MGPLHPSSSQLPHRGAELWLSTRRKLPDPSVPFRGAFWGAPFLSSWGPSALPHCARAGRVLLAVLFRAGPESQQNKSSFLAKRRAGERQPLQMRAGLLSGLPNSTFGCLNLALDGNFADVSPSGQPAARPAPTGAFATGCAQRVPFLPGQTPGCPPETTQTCWGEPRWLHRAAHLGIIWGFLATSRQRKTQILLSTLGRWPAWPQRTLQTWWRCQGMMEALAMPCIACFFLKSLDDFGLTHSSPSGCPSLPWDGSQAPRLHFITLVVSHSPRAW